MKTLANLAADGPKKRRRGGDDDDFGANDEDWGVYRTVATGEQSDEEEEEDLGGMLNSVEQELLEHDPDFTEHHTLAAQSDWTKSLVHAFLRGPWPFDPESQREAHQIHLNVERIRVPEVVFKPSIAGVDQAGLIEMVANIVNQRFSSSQDRNRLLKDVFLTGGNTLFHGFEDRFRNELRGVVPIDADLTVRQAADPIMDAWKGAAQWASGADMGRSSVSRQEYLEKGSEYMKVSFLDDVLLGLLSAHMFYRTTIWGMLHGEREGEGERGHQNSGVMESSRTGGSVVRAFILISRVHHALPDHHYRVTIMRHQNSERSVSVRIRTSRFRMSLTM